MTCPQDKIRNPVTKRCVDIHGAVAKKLIKSHIANEITLEHNNVAKLHALGILKATKPAKPVVVKPCPTDKIRNPATNRCVDLSGATAENLIKSHIDKTIQLHEANVAKLQAKGLLATPIGKDKVVAAPLPVPVPPKPVAAPKPTTGKDKPVAVPKPPKHAIKVVADLPEKYKNILKSKAKEAHERLQFQYINDEHKAACLAEKTLSAKVETLTSKLEFSKLNSYEILGSAPLQFGKTSATLTNYFNQYNKTYATQFQQDVDLNWLKNMNDYVKKLSTADYYCIKCYAEVGDKVINGILRKQHQPSAKCFDVAFFGAKDVIMSPDFIAKKYITKDVTLNYMIPDILHKGDYKLEYILTFLHENANLLSHRDLYKSIYPLIKYLNKKFWTKCVHEYVIRVNKIIRDSPPVTKKMTVYRGVKNDYFLTHSKKGKFVNLGFLSTSLSPQVANSFITGNCCLTKITLLPGTKALFIGGISGLPHELEVLLPEDTTYHMLYGKKTYLNYRNTETAKTDVCGELLSKLQVTEVNVFP